MAYDSPDLKTTIYPEPSKALEALAKFKKPKFDDRDQRPLTAIMERAIDINTRLGAHVNTRKTAVQAFGWSLVGGDDKKRAEATQRLENAINAIIEEWHLLSAYGRIGFNATWTLANSAWTVNLESVEIVDLDGYKNKYGIYDESGNKSSIELSELFLAATSDSYLKSIVFTELFRFDALKEQGNYIKKLKGILQIIDKGASDAEREKASEAATQAIKNNYLITDDAIEFKLNQIAAAGGAAFKETIESLNADISIGVLGQANTTQLPSSGGSRAALFIMKLISADIHWSDINKLENFINKQLIKYDALKNFGTAPEWKFKINIGEDYTIAEISAAIVELIQAGVPIVKSEIYKLLNLTEPVEGDVVIGGV